MAEIFLSSIAEEIIGNLASSAVQEVGLLWGVKDELTGLQDTISTIKAVLLDAEEKQNHNHQVKDWLEKLEDVVHEADELMDEFNTEAALLQQRSMLGSEMTKQVCTFFSTSNQLAFRHKLGHKIKAIKERLVAIRDDRQFYLETKVVTRGRQDTHFYVPEEQVIGRDKDRNAIIECLLDEKIEENVAVIPIVGTGGLGKTTLAQLVYNNEKVQKHFDLKLWVCVSNDFNVRLLVEKILKSATNKVLENLEMDQLQKELRKEINEKRYLLVLDDVWNKNRELWLNLEILLSNCAKGSRIIITTRDTKVGEIMSTMKPYFLGRLNKDQSWSLFEKVAFKYGLAPNNSKIVEIGMQIIEKCGGVPLAIRTIGRMLYFKNPETEWSSFLAMEFSRIPQQKNDILPVLKLSYDNLPSHLKHCFAFCKLFPKGYDIYVEQLISFWMALGFVKQSDSTQSLVDVGHECFSDLLWGSFFQELHEDIGCNKKCKMHDLMHDLATHVGGTKYILLQPNQKCIFEKNTCHVSFNFDLHSSQQIPTTTSQANKIRTILLFGQSTGSSHGRRGQSTCDGVVLSFKSVRILDLYNLGIKVVPNSIGKLKHLRYLDLSRNTDMEALPDSITMLYNLQSLILSHCKKLQELPRDTKKLVNLVNLNIERCDSLTHMPPGLNQLTNLHRLSKFVLKEGRGSSLSRHSRGEVGELKDLMELNNLRGYLEILNLGYEKDTRSANLKEKHLESLVLSWHDWESNVDDHEEILEGLQPHPNLKWLYLKNYEGLRFSRWFPSLTNLVFLGLEKCRKCKYLPPLTQFHSLKILYLKELDSLEYISNEDSSSSSMSSTTILPSLERIVLLKLPNLKGWWRGEDREMNYHSFPRLSSSVVFGCPNLTSLLLSPNIKVFTVESNTWKPFQDALENIARPATQALLEEASSLSPSSSSTSFIIPFSNLSQLHLFKIGGLRSLPKCLKNLTSLRELWVTQCSNLKCLSPGIQHHASSLQELLIDGCYQLDMSVADEFTWLAMKSSMRSLELIDLPQLETLPLGLQHVTSLQQLKVHYCKNLIEISEWISNFKSLHTLKFVGCPNLRSLPQGIRQLTSLQKLKIKDCPVLYKRCQRETGGEDLPKVAHIPEFILTSTSSSSGCNWGMLKKFRISQFCSKGITQW